MTHKTNAKKISVGHLKEHNPFLLLRSCLGILIQHPVILFPSALLAIIQLWVLLILYFAPQYPLSHFFGPLIRQLWSEEYLHYPLNLILLPKMFYYAQMFVYLFLGSFLLGLTVKIISVLNEHPRINLRESIKETFQLYVHIFVTALFALIIYQLFAKGYVLMLEAVIKEKPFGQSAFFWKRVLLWTIPYGQFFVGILSTAIITYILPIILIEREKFFTALFKNLKIIVKTFGTTLVFVGIPTMLYLPLLTIRNNITFLMNSTAPEIQILVIIFSLAVSMFIDLLVITCSTVFYLFLRENS